MHDTSEQRQWFLFWLDGDSGKFDDAAIAKLNELRSCTDELPEDYCQHGRLHLPFGASFGDAARKILGEKIDESSRFGQANDLARLPLF